MRARRAEVARIRVAIVLACGVLDMLAPVKATTAKSPPVDMEAP